MNDSITLVDFLEELSTKYEMDALGMSIVNIKERINKEDGERLDLIVQGSEMRRYKLDVCIEIEAEDDDKAMDLVVKILKQPAEMFDRQYKEFDFQITDITESPR